MEYSNIQTQLDAKQATIARTNGLQAALDAKQASIMVLVRYRELHTRAMVTDANGKVQYLM